MPFEVPSDFIGGFKIGDNICHNLSVLSALYESYHNGDDKKKRLLCKPIVLTIVSVLEAILHDFFCVRVATHTIEGVPGFDEETLAEIRDKKLDELNLYIDQAGKHDVLKLDDRNLYKPLHELRKLRNRVHIQNMLAYEPIDEYDAFTPQEKIVAERALENVVKVMHCEYPRKDRLQGCNDFSFPWDPHY